MTERHVPFDQRQRYQVAADLAEAIAADGRSVRVVDVGGYFQAAGQTAVLPIREFLPRHHTTSVDLAATSHLPGYARADAAALPFASGSADLVCALDVLEHIPAATRRDVVAELMRISRGYVLISAPVADWGAAQVEAVVAAFIRTHAQAEQVQLAEHAQFGIPRVAELMQTLPSDARGFGLGNLDRWAIFMLARHFALALPHAAPASHALDDAETVPAAVDRQPPFYRWFAAARVDDRVSAAPLEVLAARYTAGDAVAPKHTAGLLADVLAGLGRADRDRLQAARQPLESRVADLERVLAEVEASWVHRLYRLTRRDPGRPA